MENEGQEPNLEVLMNIFHINTYKTNLYWPHFKKKPRVQEK